MSTSSNHSQSLNEFKLDPANANRGTDRGRALVETSLQECGAGRSVLADRDGTIIAGNKTLAAANRLGLPVRVIETDGSELVVVKRSDLSLTEGNTARRLAYLDNRSSELGLEWDSDQLLADLQGGVDLSGIFDRAELDQLLAGMLASSGPVDPDEAPEPPESPVSRRGDLWLLGDHRLLCGDSTKAEDVRRLMAGERATLMATDPPYLVDYDGGNHPQTWANGGKRADGSNRPAEEYEKTWDTYVDHDSSVQFYSDFLAAALAAALTDRPALYQWFGMMRADVVFEAWRANGLLPHQVVIWRKTRPVLGRTWFMYDYEPCLAGWIQGNLPVAKPPANERAVWDVDGKESIEEGVAGTHPTIKPVELIRRPIEWHTKPGELIYEPFSGSGTAIVAAEQTKRRCYALELSPVFVDVAVLRWQRFAGQEAILDGDGRSFAELAAARTLGSASPGNAPERTAP
ncbi:MAG: DNA modification methylase [Thermoleophilia bacterium]